MPGPTQELLELFSVALNNSLNNRQKELDRQYQKERDQQEFAYRRQVLDNSKREFQTQIELNKEQFAESNRIKQDQFTKGLTVNAANLYTDWGAAEIMGKQHGIDISPLQKLDNDKDIDPSLGTNFPSGFSVRTDLLNNLIQGALTKRGQDIQASHYKKMEDQWKNIPILAGGSNGQGGTLTPYTTTLGRLYDNPEKFAAMQKSGYNFEQMGNSPMFNQIYSPQSPGVSAEVLNKFMSITPEGIPNERFEEQKAFDESLQMNNPGYWALRHLNAGFAGNSMSAKPFREIGITDKKDKDGNVIPSEMKTIYSEMIKPLLENRVPADLQPLYYKNMLQLNDYIKLHPKAGKLKVEVNGKETTLRSAILKNAANINLDMTRYGVAQQNQLLELEQMSEIERLKSYSKTTGDLQAKEEF